MHNAYTTHDTAHPRPVARDTVERPPAIRYSLFYILVLVSESDSSDSGASDVGLVSMLDS